MDDDAQSVALHLLTVVRNAVAELPETRRGINSGIVLLGLAELLGDLLTTLPVGVQQQMVVQVVERVMEKVPGGTLVVVRPGEDDKPH